jgi:hypothetical protein
MDKEKCYPRPVEIGINVGPFEIIFMVFTLMVIVFAFCIAPFIWGIYG